ncbi:GDSL-type esterase/lipase family protein [Pseudobutyrivibrio ruminis]|nr:GDSL-type esterase/lipase family protein [Pseudobutyrivibrio ruminis]
MKAIVDCRNDNNQRNLMELSIWGKPCFAHVINAVEGVKDFTSIEVYTDSDKIYDYVKVNHPNCSLFKSDINRQDDDIFMISGRACCISSKTIEESIKSFTGVTLLSCIRKRLVLTQDLYNCKTVVDSCAINAFYIFKAEENNDLLNRNYAFYTIPDEEGVVVNDVNDFELALVLKKKQENRPVVEKMIDSIIEEKKPVFSCGVEGKSICFIGHSQIDQWKISDIGGFKVRNCGVSGISSFEYKEKIIDKNLLNCDGDIILAMHGTNDVVWDYTYDEIADSILSNINYIHSNNKNAPIVFLSCLHVNGRLDRSNERIDKMNEVVKDALGNKVIWVDTSFMNDKYGDLIREYTVDGLHLSEVGYSVLQEKIEKVIDGLKL